MADATYQKFLKRWEEVIDLPPQTVGPLTPLYKWFAKRLKSMPWTSFVLVSVAVVLTLYLLVGTAVTSVVSLLQKGF